MSQQYLRLNKKKELEAELKQAKYTLVKEKARCFKVLNDSEPFVPKCGKEAQKIEEEFQNLCEYYGIDPDSFKVETEPQSPEKESSPKNSPAKATPKKSSARTPTKSVPKSPANNNEVVVNHFSQAFRSRMHILNKEENDKKALLDELNKKLLLLQKKNDDLTNEKHIKVVTIDKSFSVLKSQVNELHDYFTKFNNEIQSKINLSKRLVRKVIDSKKNKAQTQIDKLDAIIAQLENQKKAIEDDFNQKISKLSIQQIKDQNINYTHSDEKMKQNILRVASEVQKRFEERLKSSRINAFMDNISKKIVQLNSRIDLLTKKFNNYRVKRAQRLSSTMCRNWGALTLSLLKIGRYNEAFDEYMQDLKAEDEEISKQLKAEWEIVNGKVPGTNLTVLELRKQVVELTAQLSDLTKGKTETLKKLHKEHEELTASSQKMIEELEAKLDK